MATILPHAAKLVRRIEAQLFTRLASWGYDEIILPTFEYLDVLAPGLEAELLETCYQFVDRTTGRTLLLRPDATAQVARTIAMGLTGDTLPQRLSYRTSVFRYEPEHAGRGREIFQVGAELVGAEDVSADCEVINLLIESLQAIGLRRLYDCTGACWIYQGVARQVRPLTAGPETGRAGGGEKRPAAIGRHSDPRAHSEVGGSGHSRIFEN